MAVDDFDFDEDPQVADVPTDASLGRVRTLARTLLQQQQAVEDLEEALAAAKAKVRITEETDLPRAMMDLGLTDFGLTGGGRVQLATEYIAGITKARQPVAFKWLEDNGHGAIIKRTIKVTFPKASKDDADSLWTYITKLFPRVAKTDVPNIHGGTLKAFLKEQFKLGNIREGDTACEALGIYIRRFAEVELPDDGSGPSKKKSRRSSNDEEEDV